jgi:SPP1 gp7 family putative phage head morphogenesis protein
MADLWTERYKFTHRLEGLSQGLGVEIAASLENALEKVSGKIIVLDLKADKAKTFLLKKKYLDQQKVQIKKVLKEVYAEIGETIKTQSLELAAATPKITNKIIATSGITIKLGVPFLDKKTIEGWFESSQIDGLYFNEWMAKLEGNTAARIIKETRDGLLLSENIKQVSKRISKALAAGRQSAEGLAHNSVFQARNWAERQYYDENKSKIKAVRFEALLDRHTSPLCIGLSGQIFKLFSAPQPPLHWNCRSHLDPIFNWDTEKTVGKVPTRMDTEARTVHHRDGTTSTKYEAMRSKLVPANMTHNKWMQSMVDSKDPRDVSFAREALGPTRFKLVKSGKLKVESLYYHGKIRTIKELKGLI